MSKHPLQLFRRTPEQRMCSSKVRYRSHAAAKAAIREHNTPGGHALGTYECPLCGQWHLTSERKRPLPEPVRTGAKKSTLKKRRQRARRRHRLLMGLPVLARLPVRCGLRSLSFLLHPRVE